MYYGLKKSLHAWFSKFIALIHKQGFSACKVNPTIFQTSICADDMMIIGRDLSKINGVKPFLHQHLTIQDLGCPNYFLRIEFAYWIGQLVLRGNVPLVSSKRPTF